MTLTITPEKLAESIKAEIVRLVKQEIIPRTVSNFAELNRYVDANHLGDTDEIFQLMLEESPKEQEHQAKLAEVSAVLDPAQDAVDAWIKAGGLVEA